MEFINTDIASVVKNYTHQAVKHVVTIERFNPKRISLPGQGIDPLYELKNKLRKMYQENEISQAVYDKVREKIIPAYFGQLGANMPPALRTLSTGAIVFQNWRLLGFSQLASLPDFAGVVGRSGTLRGHWKQLRSAIRELRSEDARMMYRSGQHPVLLAEAPVAERSVLPAQRPACADQFVAYLLVFCRETVHSRRYGARRHAETHRAGPDGRGREGVGARWHAVASERRAAQEHTGGSPPVRGRVNPPPIGSHAPGHLQ
jgi:hypothetical protein